MSNVPKPVQELETVVIRFAGDSGDGMQLTGQQFTNESAVAGNDIGTLPDFPAEIRAPLGTLAGVSGFQLQFSSHDIFTPGDNPDVLVAMNPAALKLNQPDLVTGGILIVNTAAFTEKNLQRVGYTSNPLEDGSLTKFRLFQIDINKLTGLAIEGMTLDMGARAIDRLKNMFALGVTSWLFNRPLDVSVEYIKKKFASKPDLIDANLRVLKAGFNYGETTEMFATSYTVKPAKIPAGKYRSITGNQATAYGLITGAEKAGLPLFLGSYPITPATDILHELAGFKNFGIVTFQAEDEIAAVASAIGASFAGSLGITTTSGPGVALKQEAINLAVMTELPLVVVNVQRGGPSTGLPTKTEQADLFQAIYGRNGESPVPVLAASTPADAFAAAIEAVRIAVKYMTPVFLLTDGYIANGAEPWRIPNVDEIPAFPVTFAAGPNGPSGLLPYLRDEVTLARPWVKPGTAGLEHRIGGIEKEDRTGNVSYSPTNHEHMVRTRARKVHGIQREIGPTEIIGDKDGGKLLVLGWGSTYGAIHAAVESARAKGMSVSHAHLRWLNPLPADLGQVLKKFDKVLVPEMNLGQLRTIVRAEYLVDAHGLNKVQGKPFTKSELLGCFEELL
jgi:2-oxoglutarate ferredoxin oxidoreductase subunit alpha